MSNVDDFITKENGADTAPKEQASYDENEWRLQKQSEREQAFNLIDDTAGAITKDSAKFKQFLNVQSNFDRYSVGNTLLIVAQKPNATKLADYDKWKEQGVAIKKGEKSFVILEPGDEYKRADGTLGVGYNSKRVFDISQTTSPQKSEPSVKKDDRLLIKAVMNNTPVPINISDKLADTVGAMYIPETKEILIRKGMEGSDIIRSLSLEMAHAYMDKGNYNRTANSFIALSVSYIICKRIGIDTSKHDLKSLPPKYASFDTQTMRNELTTIRNVSNEIWGSMSQVLNPPSKNQTKSEQGR